MHLQNVTLGSNPPPTSQMRFIFYTALFKTLYNRLCLSLGPEITHKFLTNLFVICFENTKLFRIILIFRNTWKFLADVEYSTKITKINPKTNWKCRTCFRICTMAGRSIRRFYPRRTASFAFDSDTIGIPPAWKWMRYTVVYLINF